MPEGQAWRIGYSYDYTICTLQCCGGAHDRGWPPIPLSGEEEEIAGNKMP